MEKGSARFVEGDHSFHPLCGPTPLGPGGDANDRFGWSVALDGATSLISASNDDDDGTDSGSAYIFFDAIGALISDNVG